MNISNLNFKESYLMYHEASQKVLDNHCPIQTRKIRESEAAWIDKEYRENRTSCRKLERIWKKNRTEENRNNYINQKQVCAEMALTKQTKHYSKLVDGATNSQKSLFKVANELRDRNKKKVLPNHDDPKKLANDFNNYFVDKIKLIRKSIPKVECTNILYTTISWKTTDRISTNK